MIGTPEVAFGRIEAEAVTPSGVARLISYAHDGPVDVVGTPGSYRLELGRLPQPGTGRASFPERWGAARFEPMGEMFLIPPGEAVRAIGESGRQSSIVCEFRPEVVARCGNDEIDWRGERLKACLDMASPALRAVLRRLETELRAPGLAGQAMQELLMAEATIELTRALGAMGEARAAGGLAPWRLRRIDERLAEAGPPPSLEALALLCGLSVRQLTRGFRISRGCSIGTFIARQQARHARRLLGEGLAVKQVAHRLGFTQAAAFSNAFARATGETPRQYRERMRMH